MDCPYQCEDGGAHGISSMTYQIGQPDRLSTNIFAVTSVGLGGHRVECVAFSERCKRYFEVMHVPRQLGSN
jgi:hypothetical protein